MAFTLTVFLSTLSLRRATEQYQKIIKRELFLSTLSLRRATPGNCQNSFDAAIFYPRSPCGERQAAKESWKTPHIISIHALLAESDVVLLFFCISLPLFLSTLSLRRATCTRPSMWGDTVKFLSTLSLRRATVIKQAQK